MSPFTEDARFEQGNLSDPFYATGSTGAIGETPGSFSRSLFGKEQIKVSFPVTAKTSMLANSSSIYYFNISSKSWNLPKNAVNDHVGPFEKFALGTNWFPASGSISPGFTLGSFTIEDSKVFNAYGRPSASGSLDIFRQTPLDSDRPEGLFQNNGSSYYIGQRVSGNAIVFSRKTIELSNILLEDMPKSVQRSDLYDATTDETFELDIDRPFLIEKVVFEIPICFGQTWFQDKTATCFAVATGTYLPTGKPIVPFTYTNTGGPALTLSLFSQKKYGQSYVRDLITKGTITHLEDTKLTAVARMLPRGIVEKNAFAAAVEPRGLRNPSSIVLQPSIGSPFTGSITVKTTADVSNGIDCLSAAVWFLTSSNAYKQTQYSKEIYYPEEAMERYRKLVREPDYYDLEKISISQLSKQAFNLISSIDPFGRSMTGFAPSGGSIFGGEYVSSQAFSKSGDPIIDNPYYSGNTSFNERSDAYSSLKEFVYDLSNQMNSYVPPFGIPYPEGAFVPQAWIYNIYPSEVFGATKNSPYLVNPGDKLVLAMSKSRPAISGSGHVISSAEDANTGRHTLIKQIPLVGSTSGHDVTLNAGSINMTFYGSYVRAGDSYTP